MTTGPKVHENPISELIESVESLRWLRSERATVLDAIQNCQDVMIDGDDDVLSTRMRRHIARAAARRIGASDLVEWLDHRTPTNDPASRADDPIWNDLIEYCLTLSDQPPGGSDDTVNALCCNGISPQQIVLASQVVCLISYQARLMTVLRSLESNGGGRA